MKVLKSSKRAGPTIIEEDIKEVFKLDEKNGSYSICFVLRHSGGTDYWRYDNEFDRNQDFIIIEVGLNINRTTVSI